jgi:hypothetical protein
MKITIPIVNYQIELEILILIGVIYLVLVSHTIFGCCNFYKLMEGVETMAVQAKTEGIAETVQKNATKAIKEGLEDMGLSGLNTPFGYQISSDNYSDVGVITIKQKKEGFTGAILNEGQSSPYDFSENTPMNTSSWGEGSLVIEPGKPIPPAAQEILNRPKQPIPLPEGELLMFKDTEFKPECCPNAYSTSAGCACMTIEQNSYLINRGGNNVPYSEY